MQVNCMAFLPTLLNLAFGEARSLHPDLPVWT